MSSWHEWLDDEIERIWLISECELRRLQQIEQRPASATVVAGADVEAALARRRQQRTTQVAAPDPVEMKAALAAVHTRLERTRGPVLRQFATLGLTPSDVDALLIVAAPSIDPELADLYALLRGAGARRGVDLAFIADMLDCDRVARVALLAFLDEERTPVGRRLVSIAPNEAIPAGHRTICATPDLLWLLTASAMDVSPSLRRVGVLDAAAGNWNGMVFDSATRGRVEALAKRFAARDKTLPWIALFGPTGSGKRAIATRLAGFGKQPLVMIDARTVDKTQLAETVRRASRDATWLGGALYVGPLSEEQLLEQPAVIRELENVTAPVLLGFDAMHAPRLQTTRPLCEISLPLPSAPTRVAMWRQALGSAAVSDLDVDSIARGYKLAPGEIAASAREALALAGTAALDGAVLRGVLERRLRNELGAVATRVVVETSWADIVLPQADEARVRELIARKRYEDQVYREWGLDQRIGYGKGIIGLFSGPPGTGKTLLAGLIARELGFELYQVDLSQIFSRWVGETEKALARVFDQAERAHAVLLFDEADALFAKRTEVSDSRDRYANVAVNYLLQRLERYSGVAILTTNKDAYLDEALRRRLSLHLQLAEPEAAERLRLWEKHLPSLVPGADTVDITALANDYVLTGGYIKNVALRASFLSAAEDVPLSTEQVRRAAILELEDMGRVVLWPHGNESEPANDTCTILDYAEG
jgi:AAA+ superfamily predicted ATPase